MRHGGSIFGNFLGWCGRAFLVLVVLGAVMVGVVGEKDTRSLASTTADVTGKSGDIVVHDFFPTLIGSFKGEDDKPKSKKSTES